MFNFVMVSNAFGADSFIGISPLFEIFYVQIIQITQTEKVVKNSGNFLYIL